MDDQQFDALVGLYQANPYLFSNEQVDYLEQYSRQYQRPFRRNNEATEFNLLDTIKQLGAGFISGFTTLQVGDDPDNTAEALARNIGSLLGFVGYLPGYGMAARLATSSVVRGMGLAGRVLGAGLKAYGNRGIAMRGNSIPLQVANKVVSKLEGPADAAGAVYKFFHNTRAGEAVREGIQLGVASAASSWQQGVDQMMESFLRGGIEGVGFRALANFQPQVLKGLLADSDPATRAGVGAAIRGLASSLYSGLQSTALGEPLELQVYEYLLGAYFGVTERPKDYRDAINFIRERIYKQTGKNAVDQSIDLRARLLDPSRVEGWDDLSDLAKEEVLIQTALAHGQIMKNASLEAGRDVSDIEIIQRRVFEELYERALARGLSEEEARLEVGGVYWNDVYRRQEAEAEAKRQAKRERDAASKARRMAPDAAQAAAESVRMSASDDGAATGLTEANVGPQVESQTDAAEPPIIQAAPSLFEQRRVSRREEARSALSSEMDIREAMLDHELPTTVRNNLKTFTEALVKDNPRIMRLDRRADDTYVATTVDGKQLAEWELAREVMDVFEEAAEGRRAAMKEGQPWDDEARWQEALSKLRARLAQNHGLSFRTIYAGGEVGHVTERKTKDIVLDPNSAGYRALRQSWVRMRQNVEKPQLVEKAFRDEDGSIKTYLDWQGTHDATGKRVQQWRTPSFIEQVFANRFGQNVLSLSQREMEVDGKPRTENRFELEDSDIGGLLLAAYNNNTPFFAAVKDKGEGLHTQGWAFEGEGRGVLLRQEDGTYSRVPIQRNEAVRVVRRKLADLDRIVSEVNAERQAKYEAEMAAYMDRHLVDPVTAGKIPEKPKIERLPSDDYAQLLEDAKARVFAGKGLTDEQVENVFAAYWLNNVTAIEAVYGDGLAYDEMIETNLRGRGKFVLSVDGINKRNQVIYDGKSLPLTPGYYRDIEHATVGEDGIERVSYVIVGATRKGSMQLAHGIEAMKLWRVAKDDKTGGVYAEEFAAEHHLDGVVIVRSDLFDQMGLDMGLDAGLGTAKGVITDGGSVGSDGKPLGLMIGKLAFFRADEAQDASLRDAKTHMLVFDTAAKQIGRRTVHDFEVQPDGKIHFYRRGSDNPNPMEPHRYEVSVSQIRVNQSVSEDVEHSLRDVRLPRQWLTNLRDPRAIEAAFRLYVEPAFRGTEEANRIVREYMETRDDALLKDLDVDDIGIQELLTVLTRPGDVLGESRLYERIWLHILKRTKEDPYFGRDELTTREEIDAAIDEEDTNDVTRRVLDIAARRGLLTPATINHPQLAAPYTQGILRNYIMDRLLKPRAKHSGVAVLQPQDPWFQQRLKAGGDREGVKGGHLLPGYFMLGDAAKEKEVRWVGGEKKRLGEAWDEYRTLEDELKRLKKLNQHKTKLYKDAEARLEHMKALLNFAVIRVPADSISGTRMLQFAGFSGRRGAGMTLHNEDMINLGGADLDFDKAFWFQDPDLVDGAYDPGDGKRQTNRPLRKHIEDNKYQWYTTALDEAGNPRPVIIDQKEGKMRVFEPSATSPYKSRPKTKGGFDPKGKGTPQGDGKDQAMRDVSHAAIVELDGQDRPSSSRTTVEQLGRFEDLDTDVDGLTVMLARNGTLRGRPLREKTRALILEAHQRGARFVVGDMKDVDEQFIDYLSEIGADFTVYHSGNKPRIDLSRYDAKGKAGRWVEKDIEDEITVKLQDHEKGAAGAAAPHLLFQAGEGAHKGNQLLGPAAVAGRRGQTLWLHFAGQRIAGRVPRAALERMYNEGNEVAKKLVKRDGKGRPIIKNGKMQFHDLDFTAYVNKDLREFERVRRALMNFSADAGNYAGFRIDRSKIGQILGQTLLHDVKFNGTYPVVKELEDGDFEVVYENVDDLGEYVSLSWTDPGGVLTRMDGYSNGNRPEWEGGGKYSVWETLDGLKEAGRDLAKMGVENPESTWYRALKLLDSTVYRKVGEAPDKRRNEDPGEALIRRLMPYAGDVQKSRIVRQFNEIEAKALWNEKRKKWEGDALAALIMELAQRKALRLAPYKNVRNGRGYVIGENGEARTEPRPYTEAWQMSQDISDIATVVNLYWKGVAALRAKAGLDELRAQARLADSFKTRYARAIKGVDEQTGERVSKKEAIAPLLEEVEAHRRTLSDEVRDYFDAYMVGSMSPQDVPYQVYMEQAERDFMLNRITAEEMQEDSGVVPVDSRQTERGPKAVRAVPDTFGLPSEMLTEDALHEEWVRERPGRTRSARRSLRQRASDYYWRTDLKRFGFQVASEQAVADYLSAYNDVVQATFKSDLSPEQEAKIKAMSDPITDPVVAAVAPDPNDGRSYHFEAETYGQKFWENIGGSAKHFDEIIDPAVVGKKVAEANQRLYENFRDIMLHHPEVRQKYLGVLEATVGVTATKATRKDLIDFMEAIGQVKRGDLLGELHGRPPLKLRWWHHLFFPESIARLHEPYDTQIASRPVIRPVMTDEGMVFKEVYPVFTTFGKLHEVLSLMEQNKSSLIEELAKERQEHSVFGWMKSLGADETPVFEMAVAMWTKRNAKEGVSGDPYLMQFNKRYGDYVAKYKDKVYYIPDEHGGPAIRVTGADLVGTEHKPGLIAKRIEAWSKARYERLIRNLDGERQWIKTRSGKPFERKMRGPSVVDTSDIDPYRTIKEIVDYINRHGRAPELGIEGLYMVVHEQMMRERFRVKLVTGEDAAGNDVEVTGTLKELVEGGHVKQAADFWGMTQQEVYDSLLKNVRKEHPFFQTGYREHYFPQNGHDPGEVRAYYAQILRKLEKEGASVEHQMRDILAMRRAVAEGHVEITTMADWLRDMVLGHEYFGEDAEDPFTVVPQAFRSDQKLKYVPNPLMKRSENSVPGWDLTPAAMRRYEEQLARGYFSTLSAVLGDRLMQDFRRPDEHGRYRMGTKEDTEAWAKFGDMMVRNVVGQPSVFPQEWLDDEAFGIKRSPTWLLSDQKAEEVVRKIDKKLNGGRWFMESVPGDARSKRFQRLLAHVTQLEGKYEMISLLANTKSMMNNYVGGNLHTAISAGYRHWKDAGDLSYLRRINPQWKGWDDIDAFVEAGGGIESYIVQEAQINHAFSDGRGRDFLKELSKMDLTNIREATRTIRELQKRYGITASIFDVGALAMRTVERSLRRRAFLAHYLKWRDVLSASGAVFEPDHPWLMSMARKGVEATQFLYDNANRPAFARTNLGRILARFQLFAMNSIRFRMDVAREAQKVGFQPGTPEMERFQRMAALDLFVFALATIFPASLFDNILPAPWNYLQEAADWLFGDEEERERAFFGTYPYPLAPLQAVTPPIARIPNAIFGAILSGDYERLAEYHVWSMAPFGLAVRSLYRSIDNPAMAVEHLTGLPLHRLHRELEQVRDEDSEQQRYGIRGTVIAP